MNPSSLCILRLSAIGDVCHAAAMVERIQRTTPNLHITWVIGKIEYQLLKDMPGVEFIVFDKKGGKKARTDLKHKLAGRVFDDLFIMQVALRANIASLSIKAKRRWGFDWHRSKELHWLFANKRIKAQKHAHVLDGFLGFASALGIPEEESVHWNISTDENDEKWADDVVRDLGKFIVISPAASKRERNWLPERYAAIAEFMTGKGFSVVLCGGPGSVDRELGDNILSACEAIRLDLIGKTSLKQMLAILKRSELVIAPDTGPAHIATSVATPVIGLYAHSNPRRTGPYANLSDVVSVYDEVIEEQFGKSWQQLPWGKRAKGDNLMERITVEQVQQAIEKILEK